MVLRNVQYWPNFLVSYQKKLLKDQGQLHIHAKVSRVSNAVTPRTDYADKRVGSTPKIFGPKCMECTLALSQMRNVARSGNLSHLGNNLGNNLLHFCCLNEKWFPNWETKYKLYQRKNGMVDFNSFGYSNSA